MVTATNPDGENNTLETLRDEFRSELARVKERLREVDRMVEQSQIEVNKMAQRNAAVSLELGQIQEKLDNLSSQEVRKTYEAALDTQGRLFMMRGQLDKLQGEKTLLDQQAALLEKTLGLFESGSFHGADLEGASTGGAETVEMLIQAQEADRQRLSRQMHDGPAQSLSNFVLQTEIAMRLFDMDQQRARQELSELMISAKSAFQKVRDFIFELRPMMLDDLGLVPTLKRYVQTFADQSGTEIKLDVVGTERRLEPYLEVVLFRAIQELVGNAHRHSQANAIKINIDIADTYVRARVEDDGQGFDPQVMDSSSARGLKIINDRIALLGGSFELDTVLQQGTRITLQIPVANSIDE